MSDEVRKRIVTGAGVSRGTVLVDGFVAGAWEIHRARDAATLMVEPMAKLSKKELAAVRAEGELLLAFAAGQAGTPEVRFEAASV